MKTKLTKKQAEEKIEEFFFDLKNKKPEEIMKIKRLAMKHNIKLGKERKKFCQKCFSIKLEVKSVKKGMKTVKCKNCGKTIRWKIK